MKENLKLFNKNYDDKILRENAYKKLLGETVRVNSDNSRLKNSPLISIIIPTYNRVAQLCECIDSIMSQSYSNFEIIVVDDGSKDNTEEVINKRYKDKRIKFYRNIKNSGAGVSRKVGYQKSTGDYIIFCDDDDYYLDDEFFSDIIKLFKNQSYDLICSNSYVYYELEDKYVYNKLNFPNGISTIEYLEKFQYCYAKPNSTFTTVFRKKSLENNNFLEMEMVNDSSIYLRALISKAKVCVNDKIIGVYRIHSKNISFNIKTSFLIQNLNEKLKIYNIIKEKEYFDCKKWLDQQILLTVKYYLKGTNPAKKEKNIIFDWIRQNDQNFVSVFKDLKKYEIKLIIYNILKKFSFIVRGK